VWIGWCAYHYPTTPGDISPIELAQGPYEGHAESISALAISPDGRTIATSTGKESLILWDVETGSPLKELAVSVNSLAFRPDGEVLVAGSSAGRIYVLDPSTGALLKAVELQHGSAYRLAFNRDGTVLASGSRSGDIRLLDAHNWEHITILEAQTREVESLAFGGPQGNLVASNAFADPFVRIWDVTARRELTTIGGHLIHAQNFHIFPDGRILVADAYDTVYVWDVISGQVVSTLESHPYNPDIVFSDDGEKIATVTRGQNDTRVRLWSTFSGKQIYELEATDYRGEMVFSPDGRLFAESGINPGDGVKLWDITTGTLLKDYEGTDGGAWSLAFDPQGQVLAAGWENGGISLWRVGQCPESAPDCGALIAEDQKHFSSVSCIDFSPNGQILASGSRDHQVILWNVADGMPLAVLSEHTDDVEDVQFSPDGTNLASAGRNGEILLWDVGGRRLLYRWQGSSYASRLAFSPDGRLLASVASDYAIRLWDITTGGELSTLEGHADSVRRIVFSGDGRLLISTSNDGTVRIWGVRSDASRPTATPMLAQKDINATATATARDGAKIWEVSEGSMHIEQDRLAISSEDELPDITLNDFIAEARFYNPCSASLGHWDYGFVYRWRDVQLRSVTISSDGTWKHVSYNDGTLNYIEGGRYDVALATGANQSNDVRLIVVSDQGQLWVDEQFVATLSTSGARQAGNVMVTIASPPSGCQDNYTRFEAFTIWSLD